MRTSFLVRMIVAAALVLIGGAILAAASARAGDAAVEQRVIVDVDGAVETLTLDDLADGETRQLGSGEHTVSVTRLGGRLEVRLDGEALEVGGAGRSDTMVWLDDAGHVERRSERVFVLGDGRPDAQAYAIRTRKGDGEEVRVEVDAIATEGAGAGRTMIFSPAGAGAEPLVLAGPGRPGMVRYRCEESGSELLVPVADATADSYVCPATGCLMERVEEAEVRVIKVVTTEQKDEEPAD